MPFASTLISELRLACPCLQDRKHWFVTMAHVLPLPKWLFPSSFGGSYKAYINRIFDKRSGSALLPSKYVWHHFRPSWFTTYAKKKNHHGIKIVKIVNVFKEIRAIVRTCGIQENWSGDPTISRFWSISTFLSILGVKLAWKNQIAILKITSYLHIALTSKRIKLHSRDYTQIVKNSKLF